MNFDSRKKVLVIGDIMLDRHVYGDVTRIAPEAPIPIVKYERETLTLGGAGNVFANLLSLGINAFIVSIAGYDYGGRKISYEIIKENRGYIVLANGVKTTVKIRTIGNGILVSRLDIENGRAFDSQEIEWVENQIKSFVKAEGVPDAIIISDYNKGLINREIMEILSKYFPSDIPIFLDTKKESLSIFKNMIDTIKPNMKEFEEIVGEKFKDDNKWILEKCVLICEEINCKRVMITVGENGIICYEYPQKEIHRLKNGKINVRDVLGAGDCVMAAFAAHMVCSNNFLVSATTANKAGGIAASKLGTTVINPEEL